MSVENNTGCGEPQKFFPLQATGESPTVALRILNSIREHNVNVLRQLTLTFFFYLTESEMSEFRDIIHPFETTCSANCPNLANRYFQNNDKCVLNICKKNTAFFFSSDDDLALDD